LDVKEFGVFYTDGNDIDLIHLVAEWITSFFPLQGNSLPFLLEILRGLCRGHDPDSVRLGSYGANIHRFRKLELFVVIVFDLVHDISHIDSPFTECEVTLTTVESEDLWVSPPNPSTGSGDEAFHPAACGPAPARGRARPKLRK